MTFMELSEHLVGLLRKEKFLERVQVLPMGGDEEKYLFLLRPKATQYQTIEVVAEDRGKDFKFELFFTPQKTIQLEFSKAWTSKEMTTVIAGTVYTGIVKA